MSNLFLPKQPLERLFVTEQRRLALMYNLIYSFKKRKSLELLSNNYLIKKIIKHVARVFMRINQMDGVH